jgi:hypothetical protein
MRAAYFVLLLLVAAVDGSRAQTHSPKSTEAVNGKDENAPAGLAKSSSPEHRRGPSKEALVAERPEAQKTTTPSEQKEDESQEKASNERMLVLWTVVIAIGTAALALVAAGQLGMFLVQLRLMRKSVIDTGAAANAASDSAATMRDTARRQLRAYLTVSEISIGMPAQWEQVNPVAFITDIRIKNSGQTPAYKVKGWIHCGFITSAEKLEFKHPANIEIVEWTLGAGEWKSFRVPKTSLTHEQYVGIAEGKYVFFTYGRVEYRDVFDSFWWTNYRLKLRIAKDGSRPTWREFGQEGNDAS